MPLGTSSIIYREEILVLEGTFQDEHGNYPAGSYFRNPPGTSHEPAAAAGCTIFVRLWQFREGDQTQIVRQPHEGATAPVREGAAAARILFDDSVERVVIEDWRAGARVTLRNERGLEFLLLSGTMRMNGDELKAQSWGRLPVGQNLAATVGPEGARIWFKDAPLHHPNILLMPT